MTSPFELCVTSHWLLHKESENTKDRRAAVFHDARAYAAALLKSFGLDPAIADQLTADRDYPSQGLHTIGASVSLGAIQVGEHGDTLSVSVYRDCADVYELSAIAEAIEEPMSTYAYGSTVLHTFESNRVTKEDCMPHRLGGYDPVPFKNANLWSSDSPKRGVYHLYLLWSKDPGDCQQVILLYSHRLSKLLNKHQRWTERKQAAESARHNLAKLAQQIPYWKSLRDDQFSASVAAFAEALGTCEAALQELRYELQTARINVEAWEKMTIEPEADFVEPSKMARIPTFREPRRWVRQMEVDLAYEELAFTGAKDQLSVLNTMAQIRVAERGHNTNRLFIILGASGIVGTLFSKIPVFSTKGTMDVLGTFVVGTLIPLICWLAVVGSVLWWIFERFLGHRSAPQNIFAATTNAVGEQPELDLQSLGTVRDVKSEEELVERVK